MNGSNSTSLRPALRVLKSRPAGMQSEVHIAGLLSVFDESARRREEGRLRKMIPKKRRIFRFMRPPRRFPTPFLPSLPHRGPGELVWPGYTPPPTRRRETDRKSTRLNSSHLGISYAVFCLKKK